MFAFTDVVSGGERVGLYKHEESISIQQRNPILHHTRTHQVPNIPSIVDVVLVNSLEHRHARVVQLVFQDVHSGTLAAIHVRSNLVD